ncbi:HAD-IB family hydrolase [Xylophilus sp. Kf1]|nr:HAD-IB family hydrolase [Xylophilus sp. Kf1]
MNPVNPLDPVPAPARLAVFDLDNTLLSGDSEVLWVDFLLARGELGEAFADRNAEMDRRYRDGSATPAGFCAFYASTFAGRTPAEWAPVRAAFFEQVIRPRLPAEAFALVRRHRLDGDRPVLSTAASRFLSQPSADALGFTDLIATEMRQHADGRFAGDNLGTLNMREGKVARLRTWLAGQGLPADAQDRALADAVFYSDSINDLPLLCAVGRPVAVDPDARLRARALARHWPILQLNRTSA